MSVTSRLGSNSVRSTSRTLSSAAEQARGVEELVRRHAAGPGAGSAGKLGAVDHVDVEIDDDRLDMAEAGERLVEDRLDAALPGIRRW